MLFQSGYLTIKGLNLRRGTFILGFPNAEVREGFARSLYNYYCPEYTGSRNRMDNALVLPIYILEFKFNKTAEEATTQILKKDYAVRFAADLRPVFAVGLNISQDCRTIESYEVMAVDK